MSKAKAHRARARMWEAANSPGTYFLETLEQRLDEDDRSCEAMYLVPKFPEELIAGLLEAGISGWLEAEPSAEEVERGFEWVPDSVMFSATNSALWILGYRF